jgi:hypothetical protein
MNITEDKIKNLLGNSGNNHYFAILFTNRFNMILQKVWSVIFNRIIKNFTKTFVVLNKSIIFVRQTEPRGLP